MLQQNQCPQQVALAIRSAHLSSSMFSRAEMDRSLTASSASRHATPTAAEELMPLLSTSLDDRSSPRMPRANLADHNACSGSSHCALTCQTLCGSTMPFKPCRRAVDSHL